MAPWLLEARIPALPAPGPSSHRLVCLLSPVSPPDLPSEHCCPPQVVCMSFFDIVLDFILMDAFEDLENPPSSVLAVLRNRWLSDSFKETVRGRPTPRHTHTHVTLRVRLGIKAGSPPIREQSRHWDAACRCDPGLLGTPVPCPGELPTGSPCSPLTSVARRDVHFPSALWFHLGSLLISELPFILFHLNALNKLKYGEKKKKEVQQESIEHRAPAGRPCCVPWGWSGEGWGWSFIGGNHGSPQSLSEVGLLSHGHFTEEESEAQRRLVASPGSRPVRVRVRIQI